jgi:hypothetical protein
MSAKRRKIQRLPHSRLTPEVAFAFLQCKKLATQCSCQPASDPKFYWKTTECSACTAWWAQQTIVHHALRLPPHVWPCLPDPKGPVSPGAIALYEELDAALNGSD